MCRSLEPGKDGIGDYCQMVGKQLVSKSIPVRFLSFNDPWVQEIDISKIMVRLPRAMPLRTKWEKIHLEYKQTPSIIFLQYSPYAFSLKGIPNPILLKYLKNLPEVWLMIHETWIGSSRGSSIKSRLIGAYQKWFLKKLIKSTHANRLYTSNHTYQSSLKTIGCESSLLPLPGNIPFDQHHETETTPTCLQSLAESKNPDWKFVVFGATHGEWNPNDLFRELIMIGKKHNRQIRVVFCGRSNIQSEEWQPKLEWAKNQIQFSYFGEKSQKIISRILQLSDFGISTNPWQLVGKSGTTAAMLEHGLPVIVCRDDYQCRYLRSPIQFPENDIHKYSSDSPTQLEEFLIKNQTRECYPKPRVEEIVKTLFQDME